ncbi:MAG: RNA polymerase sigma factor (sigma-70 family) [Planctomycetota bacterium]|jgi:RNA polymerase sigma factor (sigma-70 family)
MSSELDNTLNLIHLAQEGDNEALGQIFSRYYNPVVAYVRLCLGRELRLSLDSVDVMQETFLVAVEQFDKFEIRHEAGLIHWLSRIAENRIRDHARYVHAEKRDQRRQRALRFLRDSVAAGTVQLEPAADITLPGDAAAKGELEERLALALEALEPVHRQVIMQRTYGNAKWTEVMELMGLGSEAAGRQLHARAVLELAARMKD